MRRLNTVCPSVLIMTETPIWNNGSDQIRWKCPFQKSGMKGLMNRKSLTTSKSVSETDAFRFMYQSQTIMTI